MNGLQRFRLIGWCLILSLMLYTQPAYSVLLSIDTDATWKSFDSFQIGWNNVGFDDSSWRNAYEAYSAHPDDSVFTHLANAETIWDWPYASPPGGTSGPLKAYFRYELTLTDSIERAQFSYAVDDAMTLYINGVNVYQHVGAGNTNTPEYHLMDQSLFSIGSNVIAIEAWDGSSSGVWNRGWESITANFLLEQKTVAEPATWILMLLGTMGLLLQSKSMKQKQKIVSKSRRPEWIQ